ncbi:MAG: hypothetical protein PVF14_18815 [Desulfobacterales bacterium]|jgi:uncharacterized protein (DUF3084 family)
MKKYIIAIAVICMFNISAYADNECDSKYHNVLKRLQSLTETEMAEETKNKYISQLEKAYQLCKDGNKEQAAEILGELRNDKEFDTVFSTYDGN